MRPYTCIYDVISPYLYSRKLQVELKDKLGLQKLAEQGADILEINIVNARVNSSFLQYVYAIFPTFLPRDAAMIALTWEL